MPRIGSFVRQLGARDLRKRVLVNIATGAFDSAYDASIVWNGEQRTITGRGLSALAALIRRLVRKDEEARSFRFRGLRDLLERYHNTRFEHLDGDVADAACRAIPFTHIAIHTPDAGANLDATEANLRAYFSEQIGRYGQRRPRIKYLRDPRMPQGTDLRVQFGFGVFLPEPSDLQIGRFEIALAGRDESATGEWSEPRIGGEAGMPAAFYRGQTGLVFSSALRYAPAVCQPGLLPDNHVFFFGRVGQEDPPRFEAYEARLGAQGETELTLSRQYTVDHQPSADTPEFAVRGPSGRAAFICRWRGDESHSALVRRAPEAPHLTFEGLIMPDAGSFRAVREWWVDFTTDGRLAIGPLDESAFAVASGPGGKVRLYNRANHAEAGLLASPEPVRIGGGQELRQPPMPNLGESGKARWKHRLQALKPFGHLEIGRAPVQRIIPFRSESREELSLDWLNHCGGVYARKTDDFGAPERQGLAEWSLSGAEIWLSVESDGTLYLRSERKQRIAKLTKDGLTPVQESRTQAFAPGDDVVIGCHHFRYHVPGAQRQESGERDHD
ncbi:MAG: hypothetical protein MRY63_13515 [Neomegalonema sp.]|nr:hypothetical protein [Neomegalonema sp.]